jgi:uncharacterized phiE125 gp8 family phage protein
MGGIFNVASVEAEKRDRGTPVLTTDSPFEPVTLTEFKSFARLYSTVTDVALSNLLKASRQELEGLLSKVCIQQVWTETRDYALGVLKLYKTPLISVNSITYIADWNSDALIEFPPASYAFSTATGRIATRSSETWPTHRGWQSLFVEYKAGFAALTGTGPTWDAAAQAAARLLVPEEFRTAIMQYTLWKYENPEGGIEVKNEATVTSFGALPPQVKQTLSRFIRWTI